MRKVYLDYAATTPVDPQVFKVMKPYFSQKFGNASSLHYWGQEARQAIENAREDVAKILGASPLEIIFTSCATESNNLALKGAVEAWRKKNPTKTPHFIVSPIEHHCVLDSAKHLKDQGVEVTWLKVDKSGLVNPEEIEESIKSNTVLVSIMYGNNEVGAVEPIAEIAKVINRKSSILNHKIYFHTDAVQVAQYLDINVNHLGVDMLSMSAHKFYGPKGVGILYLRKGVEIIRQQDGGSHERKRRAGTENTPGIVGAAFALKKVAKEKSKNVSKIKSLQDRLMKGILSIKDVYLTGHPKKRLPHIASFIVKEIEGEAMLLRLDQAGIAVSSGSACTSGQLEPSHVLLAMGIKPEEAHGSIRFSLGKQTSKEDIDYVLEVFPKIVRDLRKLAPKI